MIIASIVLGIGHIGIHLQHRKEIHQDISREMLTVWVAGYKFNGKLKINVYCIEAVLSVFIYVHFVDKLEYSK